MDRNDFRERALRHLREALGNRNASFRDHQLEAIESIVLRREKLLVVQRTGWGKSIVYFLATKLLREMGAGLTLLVSPLLSLMRNQIDAAERLGITAESINSTNPSEWEDIKRRILIGKTDLLLISPERLANTQFVDDVLSRVISSIGLLVVDEAHCISDWGHDFRPDYMRIARIMKALPPNTPAIATTATANNRVVEDIKSQLGKNLRVLRGPLVRHSLRLQNISLPSPAARMAWLAEHLPKIPGSGIVYTLTVHDAERLAAWLKHKSIEAYAYHSNTDMISTELKKELEQRLIRNELKALVATTALGMGFDKPDLGFVVHFQRPGSVTHYYQQVGRAGRGVDSAYGILLCGEEDDEIVEYFIETAFPPLADVSSVIKALESAPNGLTKYQLLSEVNISETQLEKVLTILSVQSPSPIVNENGRYRRTATRFVLDLRKVEQLKAVKRYEQKQMQEYMQTNTCLMEFLSRELDDPYAAECGKCANCLQVELVPKTYSRVLAAEASDFVERLDIVITPRKQWPPHMPKLKGRIAEDRRAEEGRALCLWGDAGWGKLVRRGKQVEENFADELVSAAVSMIRERWKPQPPIEWVTCIPSLTRKNLVPDYAKRLARALGIPFRACIVKVRETEPQKSKHNSYQQLCNVLDAFDIKKELVIPSTVLLVDDIVDSGWTFTVAAYLLRENGSGPVFPLALAKL